MEGLRVSNGTPKSGPVTMSDVEIMQERMRSLRRSVS